MTVVGSRKEQQEQDQLLLLLLLLQLTGCCRTSAIQRQHPQKQKRARCLLGLVLPYPAGNKGRKSKKSAYFTPTYRENVPDIYAPGKVFYVHAIRCSNIHLRLPKSGEEATDLRKKNKKQQQFRCTKRLTLEEIIAKNRGTARSYIT